MEQPKKKLDAISKLVQDVKVVKIDSEPSPEVKIPETESPEPQPDLQDENLLDFDDMPEQDWEDALNEEPSAAKEKAMDFESWAVP